MKTLFASFLHKISSIPKISSKLPLSKTIDTHLGRWKIYECSEKIHRKVDMSNEDHCGPCGYYAIMTIKSKENNENKKNNVRIITKNLPSK